MTNILIAEDDENSRVLLARILKKEGFEVEWAGNGAKALELAKQSRPDMIISDIMMPEMDGFMLCRLIKEDKTIEAIPFIFYTSTFTSRQDEELGLSLGACRFVVKPMPGNELLRIIKDILRQHEKGTMPVPELPVKNEKKLQQEYASRINNKLQQKIRELEKERQELMESEEKYRTLFENDADAILIYDPDTLFIIDANAATSKIYGYARDELIGLSCLALSAEKEDSGFFGLQRNRPDKPAAAKYSHLKKDGTFFPVEIRCHAVTLTGKNMMYAVCKDITERVKAEETAELQQKQLIQADKMVALGTLVAGVAHEINNPNTYIMSGISQIKAFWEGLLPALNVYYKKNSQESIGNFEFSDICEAYPRLIEGIHKGSRRIRDITTSLKDFSRMDDSGQSHPVDLNGVIESAIQMTASLIKKATRHFSLELDPDLPLLEGRSQQLEQVVINLVVNACQALDADDKKIRVATA